ncbi:MAG: aminotransferase class III-fold pyridoxal phosphate-dependent enzyme [Gammaproteobacteria bacterium]|nr:aminotransferase class III-fold pyridoxal phosphate-dependent enzyme [Gammaproteobacteria bacterium]
MITGFRLALGGAQAWYDITPDLTTLAKALSAGDRLAAVVGRADIMEVTDPRAGPDVPRAFQSGTGNDGTFAVAAALGAIGEYQRLEQSGEYEALAGRIEGLEAALRAAFADHGITVHVNRVRSLMQCFVTAPGSPGERDAALNRALLYPFHLALVNEGVLLALPGSDHCFFSFLHDQAACDETAAAARTVLGKYPFAEAYRERLRDSIPAEVDA